jgi:DNA-binding transcriptional ArsR family regulator
VFEVIAEPNRRAILGLLLGSEQSVGEMERRLGMTQPTVSKHLRVLREAGFVESKVDAQRRVYRLRPEPLQELDAWLTPFRQFWEAQVDALERHLERMSADPMALERVRRERLEEAAQNRARATKATRGKRKTRSGGRGRESGNRNPITGERR